MTVRLDIEEQCVEIPDLGVTMRTALSVAAQGYAVTGKRRWNVRYKGVVIGNLQVATPKSLPAKPDAKNKQT